MKVTMPKKTQSVDLIILVDRSGSMANIANDMSGGLNKFIEEQKKVGGRCRVTLADFDSSELRFLHLADEIEEVQPYAMVPRGWTPLFDAIVNTFAKFDEVATPRMDKTICLIITDGEENDSKEVRDKSVVVNLIKNKQEKEGWNIVYLGADHDAFAAGASMHINSAASYNKTSVSVNNMYGTLHKKMSAVRSCSLESVDLDANDAAAIASNDVSVDWDN